MGAAGTGGFLPSDLSSAWWWVRADMGVTKDGSNLVSNWADQIGSNDFATGGDTPTWQASGVNGQNTILFDGSNDDLVTVSITKAQPLHGFMVVKQVAYVADDQLLAGVSSGTLAWVQSASGSGIFGSR